MKDVKIFKGVDVIDFLWNSREEGWVTQILLYKGALSCRVDGKFYVFRSPSMVIIWPGQEIDTIFADREFDSIAMSMSVRFTDSLALPVGLKERLTIKNNFYFRMSQEILDSFIDCYTKIERILQQENHSYKEMVVRHLFTAYYYGLGYYTHMHEFQISPMTKRQEMCDAFIHLVSIHYIQHREVGFYANSLCVTRKYLSAVLKAETGMTALEWIEEYVIRHIKRRLLSSTLNIQQISDELAFSSQSVLGKYFKRSVGLSPQNYRLSIGRRLVKNNDFKEEEK